MEAIFYSAALIFPYAIFGGVLWPIPALPLAMQYIAYITPVALSAVGFGNIIVKGFSLGHFAVIPGLLMPLLWIVLFYVGAVYKLRKK